MTHFSWSSSTAPWWVSPVVTITAIWITARVTRRRERSSERRKATVEHRENVYDALNIEERTGIWVRDIPNGKQLELALIDFGFSRFEVYDLTRQLWDHLRDPDFQALFDDPDVSLKDFIMYAERSLNWREVKSIVNRYLLGQISLRRAKWLIWGYPRYRRTRRARRWAVNQYAALDLPKRQAQP